MYPCAKQRNGERIAATPTSSSMLRLQTIRSAAVGADRFLTNNQRAFPPAITEIHVTYPADMAADA
jgi:hypothetical protein